MHEMWTIAIDDSGVCQSVCHAASVSRGLAVQTRLDGLSFCLGPKTLYIRRESRFRSRIHHHHHHHTTNTSSYMDTDTCDWTSKHIVHLQLPLVMYTVKTHIKYKKMYNRTERSYKNIRRGLRQITLATWSLQRYIRLRYITLEFFNVA